MILLNVLNAIAIAKQENFSTYYMDYVSRVQDKMIERELNQVRGLDIATLQQVVIQSCEELSQKWKKQ